MNFFCYIKRQKQKHLFFICFLSLANVLQAQSLQKVWETDSLMSRPESAVFDPVRRVIYVSNINGKYCTKDGNGYISEVDLNGEVLKQKWADGLDSPQGLALANGKLYVADVDNIVEIDPNTAAIVKKYPVGDALFLNDVAANKQGAVFVSDCKTNKVHKLENGQVSVFLNDTLLKGTNGLFCADSVYFIISAGTQIVYRVNPGDKILHEFIRGIKNGDGIFPDGDGGYFVSGAWQGQLFHVNGNGEKELILDLRNEKTVVADITYIAEKHLLVVPTLSKTVLAYRWQKLTN